MEIGLEGIFSLSDLDFLLNQEFKKEVLLTRKFSFMQNFLSVIKSLIIYLFVFSQNVAGEKKEK